MADHKNDPNQNQEDDLHQAPPKKEEEKIEVADDKDKDKDKKNEKQPEDNKKPSATSSAGGIVEGLQNLGKVIMQFKNPIQLGFDASCTAYNTAKTTASTLYHTPGAIYNAGRAVYNAPGNAAKAAYNVGAQVVNTFSSTIQARPKLSSTPTEKAKTEYEKRKHQEFNEGVANYERSEQEGLYNAGNTSPKR